MLPLILKLYSISLIAVEQVEETPTIVALTKEQNCFSMSLEVVLILTIDSTEASHEGSPGHSFSLAACNQVPANEASDVQVKPQNILEQCHLDEVALHATVVEGH